MFLSSGGGLWLSVCQSVPVHSAPDRQSGVTPMPVHGALSNNSCLPVAGCMVTAPANCCWTRSPDANYSYITCPLWVQICPGNTDECNTHQQLSAVMKDKSESVSDGKRLAGAFSCVFCLSLSESDHFSAPLPRNERLAVSQHRRIINLKAITIWPVKPSPPPFPPITLPPPYHPTPHTHTIATTATTKNNNNNIAQCRPKMQPGVACYY